MSKIKKLAKHYDDFLFDHPAVRWIVENFFTLFFCTFSAFIFAFGFRLFISPSSTDPAIVKFAGGGISGFAQDVVKVLIEIMGFHYNEYNLQSILYIVFNIPVIILGWFGIGKRFTIYSLINVVLGSLFISIIPNNWESLITLDSQLTRTLLAGICTGMSAAVAFKADISAGGMDIVSYYLANKKSTNVGKYSISFNAVIVVLYSLITIIAANKNGLDNPFSTGLTALVYSIIYLFVSALVIDFINVRNKKAQIQIITTSKNMSPILIANFHHSATIIQGTGAYTGEAKIIIYMTVSTNEVKKVLKVAQKVDSHAFINVISLHQVYGRFFVQPVR
ncbi:MAG TPA: YitT family protein [Bacilli bacterium]|nr:YitT family protein [Bacilli bacterium]